MPLGIHIISPPQPQRWVALPTCHLKVRGKILGSGTGMKHVILGGPNSTMEWPCVVEWLESVKSFISNATNSLGHFLTMQLMHRITVHISTLLWIPKHLMQTANSNYWVSVSSALLPDQEWGVINHSPYGRPLRSITANKKVGIVHSIRQYQWAI